MTKEEIVHLGTLSRIALTDSEIATFASEIDAIVSYVSELQSIVSEESETEPQVGSRYNVLRPDEVTNEPGSFSESIIQQFPAAEGRYLKVPKIIVQSE